MKIRELRQQPVRSFVTSKGDKVDTYLSDSQAAQILAADKKLGNFGSDLLHTFRTRGLTDRQLPWFHKIACERLPAAALPGWKPENGAETLTINLGVIRSMMDKAGEKLRFPKIRFTLDEGTIMVARAGKQSRTPGAIMVTDGGPFGANTFYGRVHTDGRWEASRSGCPRWVIDALQGLAGNPAAYAAIYGKKTGYCCFCGLHLTDGRSVAVGYGPICAGNYGLPWGEENASDTPVVVVPATSLAPVAEEASDEVPVGEPEAREATPAEVSAPWRAAKTAELGEVAPWSR